MLITYIVMHAKKNVRHEQVKELNEFDLYYSSA